jgi:S-adenosylmethionine:tRNA ribosyltransferase-isomerase
MVVDRATGSITHRRFHDLPSLFTAGDLLVVNTTRVIRARLLGRRASGAPAEVFVLHPIGDPADRRFEALVSPGGKLHPGRTVHVAPDLDVEIESITDRRTRVVRLVTTLPASEALERFGAIPLPPYITRPATPTDAAQYQTVYAREAGSVAAPTAGLHFTPRILDALADGRVERADIVLHVGAGTFKPVETDDPAGHVMHEEQYTVSDDTAGAIAAAKARGAAVWAVGTTTARTLESAADDAGRIAAGTRETRLFVRPPYRWRVVDRLITNFHLPRSTLLMLVAAFAGYELTMRAYAEAIASGYRFYSYGDAMAIL